MDDIRVKVGFFDHPKTVKLKRRLGSDAIVAFQRLWAFCGTVDGRSSGDLSGMTDEDIEIAAHWDGGTGLLVGALADVGYLDGCPGSWQIHQFSTHNPWVASADKRADAARKAATARWGRGKDAGRMRVACGSHAEGMRGACDGHAEGNAPSPSPSPSPSPLPSPTPNPSLAHESDSAQRQMLTVNDIEQRCYRRCGALAGKSMAAIKRLEPISAWELDQALLTQGNSYTYLARVIESIRNEGARGPAPPAVTGPNTDGTVGSHPGSKEFGHGPQQI